MDTVELLTVEASFQVTEHEVVIVPDFSVPSGWENQTEKVTVVKPDGQKYKATARLSLAHFNISDPKVSLGKRWRVVIRLQDLRKEEVPAGSKILVSKEAKEAILPSV